MKNLVGWFGISDYTTDRFEKQILELTVTKESEEQALRYISYLLGHELKIYNQ